LPFFHNLKEDVKVHRDNFYGQVYTVALFAMAGGSMFVGVYGVCARGYVEQWGWCTTICKNKTNDNTSVEPVQYQVKYFFVIFGPVPGRESRERDLTICIR
jgi:hypothetical protein